MLQLMTKQWFKHSMDGDGQYGEPHGPTSALVEHWIKLDWVGGWESM